MRGSQVRLTIACDAPHTLQQGMSRRLLAMHDRAAGQALTCTHKFLFGTPTAPVTPAAQSMQHAGPIEHCRGLIQVAGSAVAQERDRVLLNRLLHAVQETGPGRKQTV